MLLSRTLKSMSICTQNFKIHKYLNFYKYTECVILQFLHIHLKQDRNQLSKNTLYKKQNKI